MYKIDDFNNCLFNPLVKKDMLAAYPRLREIEGSFDANHTLVDKVLRYICMLYDPKSPLIIGERDLNYRKTVAADLAGFDSEADDTFLQELYASTLDWTTTLVMRFLIRFIKQRQWALICSIEIAYWEGVQRIMRPIEKGIGDKKDYDELKALEVKAKLKDEAEKDLKRLDTLYKSFFNEDDDLENAAKNIRITPEMIASKTHVQKD
jgi:hypothetical protein